MTMMMINQEVAHELVNYVKLLRELRRDGYKCDAEITSALKRLNSYYVGEVKTKDSNDKKFILHVEDNLSNAKDAFDMYSSTLDMPVIMESESMQEFRVSNHNVEILIMPLSKLYREDGSFKDYARGMTPDYLINNTRHNIVEIKARNKRK